MKQQNEAKKPYFCYGCKHFTAMVMDDDNRMLERATKDILERPTLFVLTHCTHEENPDDSEGNTRQSTCPLENVKA